MRAARNESLRPCQPSRGTARATPAGSDPRLPDTTCPRQTLAHGARAATLVARGVRPRSHSTVPVCTTTGVKLRGPERSEGHVSFNILVGQPRSIDFHYFWRRRA